MKEIGVGIERNWCLELKEIGIIRIMGLRGWAFVFLSSSRAAGNIILIMLISFPSPINFFPFPYSNFFPFPYSDFCLFSLFRAIFLQCAYHSVCPGVDAVVHLE